MKNTLNARRLCLSVLLLFASLMAVLAHPSAALARVKTAGGAKAYTLGMNRTYKGYDITGDGKADKIRIKSDVNSEGYVNYLTVTVNGKNCLTKKYGETPESDSVLRAYPQIVLVRLKNKKPFLYIHFSTYNGYYAGGWVYRYKNKRLQELYNTSLLIQKYDTTHTDAWRTYETLAKVSGNQLWFTLGSSTTGAKTYKINFSTLKAPVAGKDLSEYYRRPYSQVKKLFPGGTDVTGYAEYNQYLYNTLTLSFPKPVANQSQAPLSIIYLYGELNNCNLFGVTVGMDQEAAFEKFQNAGFHRTTAVGITYYWEDEQNRQLAVEADGKMIISIRFGMW